MAFYCGIDLSARESSLCVVDEKLTIFLEQKLPNELGRIVQVLQPYHGELQIVVESTFNWYWLIDGLAAQGFEVCLAHTLGLHLITKAKVKTDRRDAYALAKLLAAGLIPKAYIYPAQTRPVRDLLRRRLHLVRLRAAEYGSLRRLLLAQGLLEQSRQPLNDLEADDVTGWFEHPLVQLHAQQELARIELYSQQLVELERRILAEAQPQAGFQRLLTVAGIGPILALTIWYEVGDINRFASARHFSSYCRLVPGVAQSGTVARRGRASKQGNAYLKWAFTQAAVHAVRCYPPVRRYFERQLSGQRGSGRKLVAYNNVAHKLAQAVYHIWREGVAYRAELLFGGHAPRGQVANPDAKLGLTPRM